MSSAMVRNKEVFIGSAWVPQRAGAGEQGYSCDVAET
jgi:hypothetical protein